MTVVSASVLTLLGKFIYDWSKYGSKVRVEMFMRSTSILVVKITNRSRTEPVVIAEICIMVRDDCGIPYHYKDGAQLPEYCVGAQNAEDFEFFVDNNVAPMLRFFYRPSVISNQEYAYIPIYARCITSTGKVFKSQHYQFSNKNQTWMPEDQRLKPIKWKFVDIRNRKFLFYTVIVMGCAFSIVYFLGIVLFSTVAFAAKG